MAENSDTQSSTTQFSTENPSGQVTKKSSILYSEAITVKKDVIDEIALSSGLVRDGNTSHVYSVPSFHGFPCSADGNIKMFPVMYPVLVPGLIANPNHEQRNRGAGIYAVPVLPFTGSVAGIPSNTLIPLTYSIPTRPSTSDAGAGGGEQNQLGQQQQQIAPQRQIVVRRFQIAFQVDLLLILKLAAVIFLFNQDGSRQRLALLVFLASLVYLYQTGALAPFVRWVSQAMHRAAAPPRPPRLVARAEANVQPEDENIAAAEGQLGAENDDRPRDDANGVAENDGAGEAGANGGNRWWRMVKEVQMIVFGFITSLLPGFHNVDHA